MKSWRVWLCLAVASSGIAGCRNIEKRQLPAQRSEPAAHNVKRAMLSFSSASRPNVLYRRDWYAVWIYTPLAQPRVLYSPQAKAISTQARLSTARETAIINGGYYVTRRDSVGPLIGDVATGNAWQHGVTPGAGVQPLRRWTIGWQLRPGQTPLFDLELTAPHRRWNFAPAPDFQKQNSFGLSALLCLIDGGAAQVWRDKKKQLHVEPPGQWPGLSRSFGPYFRHAALGWSADGKHLFFLVQHNPRSLEEVRNLFGRYEGKNYVGEGTLLPALRKEFAKLPITERPCDAAELPRRIENAVLLDGGHCAGVIYRRRAGKRVEESGSWLTGRANALQAPPVPTMIEASTP